MPVIQASPVRSGWRGLDRHGGGFAICCGPVRITYMSKKILDVTCGMRGIWFDKKHPAALYCDRRKEEHHVQTKNGGVKNIVIDPDVVCDFTELPFEDNSFSLVVFDPPHLTATGENSLMNKLYTKLEGDWRKMLHDGFRECMRVLKSDGVLIFKWSETSIPAREVWDAIGEKPLFGHRSGKKSGTFWGCYMKLADAAEELGSVPAGERGLED